MLAEFLPLPDTWPGFASLAATLVAGIIGTWIREHYNCKRGPTALLILGLIGGALYMGNVGDRASMLIVKNKPPVKKDDCESKAGCKMVNGECRCGALERSKQQAAVPHTILGEKQPWFAVPIQTFPERPAS